MVMTLASPPVSSGLVRPSRPPIFPLHHCDVITMRPPIFPLHHCDVITTGLKDYSPFLALNTGTINSSAVFFGNYRPKIENLCQVYSLRDHANFEVIIIVFFELIIFSLWLLQFWSSGRAVVQRELDITSQPQPDRQVSSPSRSLSERERHISLSTD